MDHRIPDFLSQKILVNGHLGKPCLFYLWSSKALHTPHAYMLYCRVWCNKWWLSLGDKGAFRKYCSGSIHTSWVAFRYHILEPCLQWFTHWPTLMNPSSSLNLIIHIFQFFVYISMISNIVMSLFCYTVFHGCSPLFRQM